MGRGERGLGRVGWGWEDGLFECGGRNGPGKFSGSSAKKYLALLWTNGSYVLPEQPNRSLNRLIESEGERDADR